MHLDGTHEWDTIFGRCQLWSTVVNTDSIIRQDEDSAHVLDVLASVRVGERSSDGDQSRVEARLVLYGNGNSVLLTIDNL